MYKSELNGRTPVAFEPIMLACPPDCGGTDFDEVVYAPVCPKCRHRFGALERDEVCKNCGTKLFWNILPPYLLSK